MEFGSVLVGLFYQDGRKIIGYALKDRKEEIIPISVLLPSECNTDMSTREYLNLAGERWN